MLVAVSPGGAASAEYQRWNAFAVERKALTDRNLLLHTAVVVAREQNRPAVGLKADQSCVSNFKAPGQLLSHRGEHLVRRHCTCDQSRDASQSSLLIGKHA